MAVEETGQEPELEPEVPVAQQITAALDEEAAAAAGAAAAEADAAAAPAADDDPVVEFEGTQLRRSEAQALLNFRQWAAENPQQVAEISDYLEGRRRLVPLEEQPPADQPTGRQQLPPGVAAPERIELSEEDLADLPEPVRAKLGQIDSLTSIVEGLQNQTFEDARARNLAALGVASQNFAQRYGLTAEDVEQLERQVAQAGILPAMVQAAGRDLVRGTEDALEVMYFRSPAGRQREIDRMQNANRDALARQRKAGKLAGSGGTSPRTPEPTQLTPEARKQAMIDEIARAQRGGTQE